MQTEKPHLQIGLGYVLQLHRARLRITQEEAARRAGMHRNYFGAIERGELNPTLKTLQKLADGLDTPLSALLAEAVSESVVAPRRHQRDSPS